VNQNFGITSRPEDVAVGLQLPTQLDVIVHLAIVSDDDLTVFVRQRLRTPSNIDDAQTDVREADVLTGVETVAIWTPMLNGRCHAGEFLDRNASGVLRRNSGDATH
jgi:hypothetical protein